RHFESGRASAIDSRSPARAIPFLLVRPGNPRVRRVSDPEPRRQWPASRHARKNGRGLRQTDQSRRRAAALSMIQRLDPPGVGARDLKECFLLQIGPHTPMRDVLITLITSHLEDLAENRLPVIERKTGYSLDVIKDAREELQHLNPWPG